ncbi:MAG TPA: phosphate ABC transporter permease subunit PstC [Actinomycetes bacterium]|nr:phosphate ABC transporter permease subunit PstC [Actinomycetes bacterium]
MSITTRKARTGERVIINALFVCAVLSIAVTVGIVAVLLVDAVEFFRESSLVEFLTGTVWAPGQGSGEGGQYGVLPLVNGTLMIGLGAIVVGLPLGVLTAIYLSEYANPKVRGVLKPTLEILAGIPTVIVGYFALQFITPSLLRPIFGEERVFVFNAAAGAVAVGLMILPIIASISEDAMRSVPSSLREAAFGLGSTKRQVSLRVVVPAALSGIAASVILAFSRAVGETMAVTIAAGNSPKMTFDYFTSIQTLTAAIAQTVSGEAAAGTVRYNALFALGLTLFVITLVMNLISARIVRRFRQVYS